MLEICLKKTNPLKFREESEYVVEIGPRISGFHFNDAKFGFLPFP